MISVLASEADHPVVREFFELFKTPWRFYEADAPASILLCACCEVPANTAALVIIFAGEAIRFDPPVESCKLKGESRRLEKLATFNLQPGTEFESPIYGRRLVDMGLEADLVFVRQDQLPSVVRGRL